MPMDYFANLKILRHFRDVVCLLHLFELVLHSAVAWVPARPSEPTLSHPSLSEPPDYQRQAPLFFHLSFFGLDVKTETAGAYLASD